MNITSAADGIYRLSANAEDILFEGLWPIPNGVSMNSYIVQGEKTAIIDGVCGWDGVPQTLFSQFEQAGIDVNSIDYVVINHMEPDHSGWLEDFRKIRPDFTIVTSKKAVPMLESFYGIHNRVIEVGKTATPLTWAQGGSWPSRRFPTFTGRKPSRPSTPSPGPSSPATPSAPSGRSATLPMTTSSPLNRSSSSRPKRYGTMRTLSRPFPHR